PPPRTATFGVLISCSRPGPTRTSGPSLPTRRRAARAARGETRRKSERERAEDVAHELLLACDEQEGGRVAPQDRGLAGLAVHLREDPLAHDGPVRRDLALLDLVRDELGPPCGGRLDVLDRKSTRLNSSHVT